MFKWFWTIFSLGAPVSAHALTLEAEILHLKQKAGVFLSIWGSL